MALNIKELQQCCNDLIKNQQWLAAQDKLRTLNKIQPKNEITLKKIAECCTHLSNHIGSKYYYHQILKLNKNEEIIIKFAELSIKYGFNQHAIKFLKKGLKISKNIPKHQFLFLLSTAFYADKEIVNSLKYIEEAIKLEQNNIYYLMHQNKILQEIISKKNYQIKKKKKQLKNVRGKVSCDGCSQIKPNKYFHCNCGEQVYCSTQCQKYSWKKYHNKTCKAKNNNNDDDDDEKKET